MKFAHLVREKTGAEVWEFYIDIRSPGKLYEEFYNRVQEEGVHLVRGKVAEITDIPERPEDAGRLTVVAENTLTRRTLRLPVDMVVLSVGLEPAEKADSLGKLLGLQRDRDGWFNELHVKLAPVKTATSGIFLAGCCQGPKDIPDTVAQASAAAGRGRGLAGQGDGAHPGRDLRHRSRPLLGLPFLPGGLPLFGHSLRRGPEGRGGQRSPVPGLRQLRGHLPQQLRRREAFHGPAGDGRAGSDFVGLVFLNPEATDVVATRVQGFQGSGFGVQEKIR